MAKVIRDLIHYEGIETCRYTNRSFRAMNIDNTFCIPVNKSDIEKIVKVGVNGKVYKYKLIKTPVGRSLEGQILTGYKLLIMGELQLEYQYVELEKKQNVHTVYNRVPFAGSVVMPEMFNICEILHPMILIEDIDTNKVSTRCIYTNVTIMLNVDICQNEKEVFNHINKVHKL
ncbi:hypothetical protein [Clostridium sp.]|uniref:hypothetical protein n=1 Tax=Clostridium sp. TaxID=1506 RepID=UPI003F36BE39